MTCVLRTGTTILVTLLNALSPAEQKLYNAAIEAGHTFDIEGQDKDMHVILLDAGNKDARQLAHGDVLLEMIDPSEMPSLSSLQVRPLEGGCAIVAHSESGHHHVVPGSSKEEIEANSKKQKKNRAKLLPEVRFYGTDRFEESYVVLTAATPVRHLKPDAASRHKTVVLPAGTYRIRRGTETLRGKRQAVQD